MMSKEAKIGLLFSLIFIVAIAVILRNVHEEAVNPYMNVDVTPTTVNLSSTNNNELNGNGESNQNNRRQEPTAYVAPGGYRDNYSNPGYNNSSQYDEGRSNGGYQPSYNPDTNAGYQSESREVRYSINLPKPENFGTPVNAGGNNTPVNQEPEYPFGMNSETYQQYLVIRNKLEEEQRARDASVLAGGNQKQANSKPVIHTVAEGENLTAVAKQYYGNKEGNRLVNIEKIYEANKDILTSINSVKVGQRLRIPEIEGITSLQGTTGGSSNTVVNAPITVGQSKVYTVVENDSLWKIAEKELGNGGRYQEIMDLNSKTLKDANSLTVGMKLRLPAK